MAEYKGSLWICSKCRRQIPTDLDECRCGGKKQDALGVIAPDTLIGKVTELVKRPMVAGALGLGAVVVLAWAWLGSPGTPPPSPPAAQGAAPAGAVTPPVTAPPVTAPPPVAGQGITWQPMPPDSPGQGMPPDITLLPASPSASDAAKEAPTNMEAFRKKIADWRERYHAVAEKVAGLEKEVADLEARAARAGGMTFDDQRTRPPDVKPEAEAVRERLPAARKELEDARKELADVEEAARRDGVTAAQLH